MVRKKMNLKKRKKIRIKLKILFYFTLMYLGFAYSFYYCFKEKESISNEEFINILVSTGNANILNEYKTTSVVNKTMNYILNIDFNNPLTLLNSSIFRYGEKEKIKEISLEYNDDYSNMDELEEISDYIDDPNPTSIENPIIYLYNSHQLENYNSENLNIYGITPNVLMASYILRENLNSRGISTIVEEANMSDILKQHNWNYSYSYQASRITLEEKKNKYNTLEYFIDIHRDSISKNYSTVTIGDKNYAKILFVIGKEHANWSKNNEFATKLNTLIEQLYKGMSRGIILKEGVGVNGIYNQDISPNCLLIEVGGVDNTIEEVNNTMIALADILTKYIKGA